MSKIELSLWIEANFPANSKSAAMRKPVYGVGINDAKYITGPTIDGKVRPDPFYKVWTSMLQRCYDHKWQAKNPTYIGCTVHPDWLVYSVFRSWCIAHHVEGWQPDKDLLRPGNKEYCPDACIFVPNWLNSLTVDCGAARGEWPLGVYFDKQRGKFRSRCSNPITGKQHRLGYFTTPEAAHAAWLIYKLELADELKQQMDAIDHRIYPNVISIITAAQ